MLALHVHITHAAHTAHTPRRPTLATFLFHHLRDGNVGRKKQACNRGSVLQSEAHDLGRVDDAHLDEIAVRFSLGVEAEVALPSTILFSTTEDSTPEFATIRRSGSSSAR